MICLQEAHADNTQALIAQAQAEVESGNIHAAFALLAKAQHAEPSHQRAWQYAAALASRVRDWPQLRHVAQRWTQHQPLFVPAWQALSRGYFEDSLFQQAIEAFAHVLKLEPGNVGHLIAAARLATAAQNLELARTHLTTASATATESADLLYAWCRLYQLSGDLAGAENYCRRTLKLMPSYVPAYTALGVLTEGRLDDEHMYALQKLIAAPGMHPEYRAMLAFTLGDALDRRCDYDSAFSAWDLGNRINASLSQQEGFCYDPQQHEADVALLRQMFADISSLPADNQSTVQPIFVTGMPRSGTTVAESILASHSDVHGAGELPVLLELQEQLLSVARDEGVAAARRLLQIQAVNWRTRYLQSLPCVHGKTRIVDKQPLNFRSVGLIRLLFPQAPVIYTQRDALDTGLSIYRHNFARNWPCASSLSDIGHYQRVHQDIVTMWRELYPDAIHVLDHAALVADPDTQIRALLSYARLDFETACLAPHKTRRTVATFSSVQVQQPLSSGYSGRAGKYKMQLAPLREAHQSS